MNKIAYAENLMQGLKEHILNHPDEEYRKFLRSMIETEKGRDMLATLMMNIADENGIEIKKGFRPCLTRSKNTR